MIYHAGKFCSAVEKHSRAIILQILPPSLEPCLAWGSLDHLARRSVIPIWGFSSAALSSSLGTEGDDELIVLSWNHQFRMSHFPFDPNFGKRVQTNMHLRVPRNIQGRGSGHGSKRMELMLPGVFSVRSYRCSTVRDLAAIA
jgi:hypothetical protein